MSPRTIKEGINNGSIPSAVSDTGATSTAGTLHDPFIHSKTRSTKIFMLPTGTTTAATIQAQLLLLNVRPPANTVDIVPNLHQTLLSGSKFADADYTAVYDKHEVNFYDSATINITERAVLTGYRCPRTGLWRIPLRPVTVNENIDTLILDSKCGLQSTQPRYHVPTPTHIREHLQASLQCNTDHILNVYELHSIEQSIRYLHAAAGFPTKSTWLAAIRKGNYSTWPLITVKNVHKHFPQSEETQQGHMRNQHQGTRSTKQALPQAEPCTPLPQLHDIFIQTYDTHGTLYTDQTGKFPHLSSRNRYQMILYHVDSNSIWAEPTKNKTEGELILARNRALQHMKACGIQPTRQVLDNEISAAYKLAITASGMTYQLVPPDDHRRNIAEKAIQTWKDHFIAVISGTDAKFPLHLWCQLLPQMERQLCLLRQSNAYPHISSHTHLYGHHDYNAHPFVPWAWKPLSTTNPTAANLLPNTAPRGMSSAHPTSTTAAGKCGHQLRAPPVSLPQSSSNTNAIIAAAANLSHLLTNNLQAHHNNKVNQSDLTRLQILTQPSPPPQHNATHYQQHSPNATHPSSPAAVSNYDSDSSDSDDESITIPHPVPRLPLQPPRVSPQQTKTPLPRVSAPSSSPAYNTHSRAHTITQETILHLLHKTGTPLTPRRAATRQFPREALSAILDTDTGELLEYRHLIKNPKYCTIWKNAYGKELGRLAQGIPGTVKGTNTIVFIAHNEIPPQRRKDVTYGCIVANYRPKKEDPYRIRLTVGGNRITYPGDCGTPTADMLTTKILLNSVISTKGARFMTIDIKDFYLNTPMVCPEYMRLKLSDIQDHIIKLYKLDKLVTTDGYVYVLIQKGMYGLPQAGIIAQQLLEKRLALKGYRQSSITPGFWKHNWRPISFTLCVDDFGVKYVGIKHAQHLLQTLNEHYETSQDWKASTLSSYPRTYGAKQQFVDTADDSALLSNTDKTFVQEVIGVFLYYARAVDCTMLPALGSLATQQSAPTQNTMSKIHQFLDYAMTHPDAMITYRAGNMILAVHSEASYLSETKARSRAGGHFFLSEDDPFPRNNGAILTLTQIIKPVMSSAAEAELGALYINARETIPQRHLLNELGHPQPPTPIQIDNSTALGVVTNIIQPKRTKAMDMRFHWLRCRENQKQFCTYWRAGTTNLADYVTKHHPAIHHQAVRHIYLSTPTKLLLLRHKAHNILKVATTLPTLTPHACAA
eukprot:CCRYP_016588-RA/>CCRYP_016588-RA protein AED:0.03 eAED:0.02 QI:0/0/0/1/1/1/3/0/1217